MSALFAAPYVRDASPALAQLRQNSGRTRPQQWRAASSAHVRPIWGWTANRCPYFPAQTNAGEYRFPVRLGLRRWHRGRSSKRRHATAEVQNEGTPFRCLGPHTHWKAPAEAQARFSEDIPRYSFTGCIRLLQHSHTAGQIELAELFKYNNSAANRQQPGRALPTSFMMGKYELENVLSSVLGRVPRGVHRVR